MGFFEASKRKRLTSSNRISPHSVMSELADLSGNLQRLLWGTDIHQLSPWRRRGVHLLRFIHAILRDFTQGYVTLQAMSLVYTTLLSLVPLLAVSFSVLKGFGVHNQIEPLLLNALAPLGEQGAEITQRIIGFVDNMKVGVLGSLGMAMLLYTVISLIQKIEQAFNYTWRVKKPRSFAQRFSQYLSVLMVGPVLFFSAVGLTASVRSTAFVQTVMALEPLSSFLSIVGRLIPYLMISLAFAFVYVFVPNTRVNVRSAMVGAFVAGALWQSVGWIFATFMAGSTKYTAIYSSLAILILFMIWIYIAWLILLIGASIAFYHQHPEYLTIRGRELALSNRLRERLALLIGEKIARNHYSGDPPLTSEELSRAIGLPESNVQETLNILEAGGFLMHTDKDPPCYLPAHSPTTISVKTLLDHVSCYREGSADGCGDRGGAADVGVGALERRIDTAVAQALEGLTLRDLADPQEPDPAVESKEQ